MYHAACKVEFQPFNRSYSHFTFFIFFNKKLKNVSCEYDRLNGWNSTLQAAWYIRHVRIIWILWTKRTTWLLILSFTQNIVFACSMFYPYERDRSVTPLDAARVNRTIFHNHSIKYQKDTLHKYAVQSIPNAAQPEPIRSNTRRESVEA